jgi:putative NADH-flavin reductase
MKIALFGANGTIGQRILREALDRGHEVTAIVRDPSRFDKTSEKLSLVAGDIADPSGIAGVVKGHDVVISAVGPKLPDGDPQIVVEAARSLLEGVERAGVKRLLVVGGAGSLEAAPGVQIVDTPDFPAAWKPVALAHRDALDLYRNAQTDLDWTYLSPAALIQPGERTGKYRIGGDQLLVDERGESRISVEDYAVALLDEVENPRHIRLRITVAY